MFSYLIYSVQNEGGQIFMKLKRKFKFAQISFPTVISIREKVKPKWHLFAKLVFACQVYGSQEEVSTP